MIDTRTRLTLIRYQDDEVHVGALDADGLVHDVTAVARAAIDGIDRLFPAWERTIDDVESIVRRSRESRPLHSLNVLPPLLPTNMYCLFGNYDDHVQEMGGGASTFHDSPPSIFQVPSSAVIGPFDDVQVDAGLERVDWEGELAVVIREPMRAVSASEALDGVAGYAVLHDVSIRDKTLFTQGPKGLPDWISMKGRETFKPLGPGVTPSRFIENPQKLLLTTTVNGVVKQKASTATMIHRIGELLEWISRRALLLPGDVIATGTPAGVGLGRGEFLADGDIVEISIESLGMIRNRIVIAA